MLRSEELHIKISEAISGDNVNNQIDALARSMASTIMACYGHDLEKSQALTLEISTLIMAYIFTKYDKNKKSSETQGAN